MSTTDASESSGPSAAPTDGPYLEIVTAASHSWRVTVQDLWLLVLLIGLGSSVLLTGARVWADAGGVL
jgi:hypothetical protein